MTWTYLHGGAMSIDSFACRDCTFSGPLYLAVRMWWYAASSTGCVWRVEAARGVVEGPVVAFGPIVNAWEFHCRSVRCLWRCSGCRKRFKVDKMIEWDQERGEAVSKTILGNWPWSNCDWPVCNQDCPKSECTVLSSRPKMSKPLVTGPDRGDTSGHTTAEFQIIYFW